MRWFVKFKKKRCRKRQWDCEFWAILMVKLIIGIIWACCILGQAHSRRHIEKEGAKQLSIFKAKSSRTYRILGPKPINNHNTSVQEPSTKRDPQAILANTIYQTEPRTLFLVERTRTIITQPPNTPQSLPPATRFSVSHKVNQTRQKINQQHRNLR